MKISELLMKKYQENEDSDGLCETLDFISESCEINNSSPEHQIQIYKFYDGSIMVVLAYNHSGISVFCSNGEVA